MIHNIIYDLGQANCWEFTAVIGQEKGPGCLGAISQGRPVPALTSTTRVVRARVVAPLAFALSCEDSYF